MKVNLTKQFIERAIGPTVWDFGNEVLYRLCSDHPSHKDDATIIAKIWLIGRSYAAAIERRRGKDEMPGGDGFYEKKVAPAIKSSLVDAWLRAVAADTTNDVALTLETHGKVTALFTRISKMQKRSLASKYLHFHAPERFYIFDSRAGRALASLIGPARRRHAKGADRQYASFVYRCELLNDRIQEIIGRRLNARELDKVLLAHESQLHVKRQ